MLLLCSLLLVGCGQRMARYTQESFSVDSPYQRKFAVQALTACEGARRALLGDGYIVDGAGAEGVKGRKAYRSDADRSTFVEMSVVCASDPTGSTLYANGLLSTYEVKTSSASASVGVSAIGSVSLPFGRSADSMVKTADETINEREFYRRFFVAVQAALESMRQPDVPAGGGRTTVGAAAVKPRQSPAETPGGEAAAPDRPPQARPEGPMVEPGGVGLVTPPLGPVLAPLPVAPPVLRPVAVPVDQGPVVAPSSLPDWNAKGNPAAAPVVTPPPLPAPSGPGTPEAPAPVAPQSAAPSAPSARAPFHPVGPVCDVGGPCPGVDTPYPVDCARRARTPGPGPRLPGGPLWLSYLH